MKNNFKNLLSVLAILLVLNGCKKTEYTTGDLTAPANLVINTEIVGQDGTNPDGDGSGVVNFRIDADNALGYKIDYDASDGVDLIYLRSNEVSKTYSTVGTNTYLITVVVYGKGGTSSTITKEITLRVDFTPDPAIVTNITNDDTKTWVVDKDVAGHFGVGPWEVGSIRPQWWSAAINEKVACCNCFYTTTFTFKKLTSITYSLQVTAPDGAFTKTGALTTLPGIPASGDEGCYSSYAGGTSSFSFAKATSGAPVQPADPANYGSTQTSMVLSGVNTFIGYGALQKEYEILESTPTFLLLRIQGTETGNAWYLKLKAL